METPDFYLRVSIPRQCLDVLRDGRVERTYPVSTAKNGPGEKRGSECTPRGWHKVRAKIGGGLPSGAVLVGRRPTGQVYGPELEAQYPLRDWILTRILWLGGLEPGRNRYGEVDTAWRFIYIHGSPGHGVPGQPASHGCIRMKNADILELYDRIPVGVRVLISEQP
ncbi:L,D-transpeptidase [Methylogaea oryzae]|uniref:L,D-transpeptidase n=1 Tax=Methylogaea oryzae TaxID=1295382 RepID=A0A8D4VMJ5_9GAMM|nr:L,D-transpeptidase [Methylogaea oryzae]BBL69999.1 L,D-transpeptidase [Methylogaea oryzae]